MTLTLIWQRYIFKDLVKCFLFFLLCFFLLYSLADFSTHAQDFIKNKHLQVAKLTSFYSYQFLKRLQLLLPLAFLISTIKVLSTLNTHKELVALQVSGLKIKKILAPLWLLASLCCITGYINEEIILPKSTTYFDESKQTRSKNPLEKLKHKQFTVLELKDSSRLVYQRFDSEKNAFFDVYWIRSFDDIWRIKYLSSDPHKPLAEYADHLLRNKEGFLEKKESYEQCLLPSLKWKTSQLNKRHSSIKHQSITTLAKLLFSKDKDSFHARGEISTYFFYKLIMPLLSFIILLGVAPYCIGYSRTPPLFLLYGISIFSFILFFTLMNSMIIIGENQTLPPYIAMGLPFLLALGICHLKYRTVK